MNEIVKIGVTGKILTGKYRGWGIFIKDVSKKDDGYLILKFNNIDTFKSTEGYDGWAQDKSTLIEIFKESKLEVEWLDDQTSQQLLLQGMFDVIKSYLNEKTEDFPLLLRELDAGLDDLDTREDKFVELWYSLQASLYILKAMKKNDFNKEIAVRELTAMKELILKKIIVKIGIQGRIIEGELKDWYIFVQDNTENAGGYSIIFRPSLELADPREFNDWVENFQSLQEYFQKKKWQIQWLDSEASHA